MSTTTDLYRYPYGAPDLPETEAATQRRIQLEHQIDPDWRAHIEDELRVGAIRNGELVTIPESQLTDDERRAAYWAMFAPNY